jgi:adenosylcobinamide kinase/adenosylcobinamide-phosphate guanylyltransferase
MKATGWKEAGEMGELTLILGGARSGKSTHAQRLAARRGGRVVYLATARALDHEMEARIQVHRSERPAEWITIEASRSLADVSIPLADTVLLDCVTMLATNVLMDAAGADLDAPDEASAVRAVEAEIAGLLEIIRRSPADWIAVTNEVGLGLVPPYPLGRLYRDLLGWANQRLAAAATQVFWMAAGIPVPIHTFRVSGEM